MKDKYYQPNISEFRVGFEYEEWNEYQKEWCKSILSYKNLESLGSFMYHFLESFESNQIRNKYLDQQDIESLGFGRFMDDGSYSSHYLSTLNDGEDSWHIYTKDKNHVKLSLREISRYGGPYVEILRRDVIRAGGPYTKVFNGKIKNISELKQVLTMIGVKYD